MKMKMNEKKASKVYMIVVTDPSEENGQQFVRPRKGERSTIRPTIRGNGEHYVRPIQGERFNKSSDPSGGTFE